MESELIRNWFAAWPQEPELLEEVLKVQGGHEGLAILRFQDALAAAAAAAQGPAGGASRAGPMRGQTLAQADVLRLLERAAESWGQVCGARGQHGP